MEEWGRGGGWGIGTPLSSILYLPASLTREPV